MMLTISSPLLIASFLLLGTFSTVTEAFKAEYANAKLPVTLAFSQPVYDGNDSIYLFGGYHYGSSGYTNGIYRYNISSDTIEKLGEMPSVGYRGSVESVGNDIYYFGGAGAAERESPLSLKLDFNDVIKYNPATNEATNVAKIPVTASFFYTSFQLPSNSSTVYFWFDIGNAASSLVAFDMTTYESTTLLEIPKFNGYSSVVSGNYVYIFGNEWTDGIRTGVMKVDMTSWEMQRFAWEDVYVNHLADAVSDGENAYLLRNRDPISGDIRGNLLVQFNLETQIWTSPEVENIPVKEYHHYTITPTSAYIQKLNRIYYFGGSIYNGVTRQDTTTNEIWYIDLI